MRRWLEVSARPSVRPPTYRQYEQYVRNHIIPGLGNIRLQALKAPDIQAFYKERLDRGLAPRSVRIIHAVLHRALEQAVKWGLIVFNPADRVDLPKIAGSGARPLSPEEVRRFLEAARASAYYPLFVVAVCTGLRMAEINGLRSDDVDLEAGAVYVRRILYRMRGQWVESEPKSGAGKRKVVLPAPVLVMLREYRKAQLEQRLKAGPDWHQEFGDLVFSTASGRPIHPANIHRELKAVLSRAALPPIRFHDLRHTHATLLLALGENARVVQERLGHSHISLTLQTLQPRAAGPATAGGGKALGGPLDKPPINHQNNSRTSPNGLSGYYIL
jgi:integrase